MTPPWKFVIKHPIFIKGDIQQLPRSFFCVIFLRLSATGKKNRRGQSDPPQQDEGQKFVIAIVIMADFIIIFHDNNCGDETLTHAHLHLNRKQVPVINVQCKIPSMFNFGKLLIFYLSLIVQSVYKAFDFKVSVQIQNQ